MVTGGAYRGQVQTDTWHQDLPTLPADLRILTLSGRAVVAGAWQVRISADPTVHSQIDVQQPRSPFAASLAGAVTASTRRSALGDLGRRRPLLPLPDENRLVG
jgi:hypothetical protein